MNGPFDLRDFRHIVTARPKSHDARPILISMREIYSRMAELEREGRRFAVCTVVRTVGSTPQVVGAKLIVDDLGRLAGTLGGGCVEGDAFASRDRFGPGVDVVRMDMVDALRTLPIGWNTFIVIATRGHKLDASCLREAVKRDARYVGLLGSKRKTVLIAKMLSDKREGRDRREIEKRLADLHDDTNVTHALLVRERVRACCLVRVIYDLVNLSLSGPGFRRP